MNTRTATAAATLVLLQAGAFASLDDEDALLCEPGTLAVAAGAQLTLLDAAGAGLPQAITGLQSAVDVCFAPDGTLLVSDDVAEAVYVRGANGWYLGALSAGLSLSDPAGLAVGPGGELWVASRGTDTLVVFDADGQHARDVDGAGLDDPWGLAFDASGRLHVADSGDDEIVVLDVGGAWLDAFGAPGLDEPRGLCFDRAGRLFVASHAGDAVLVFGAPGELDATWTAAGTLDGPVGLAVGPDGHLYVSLPAQGEVAVLDAQTGARLGALGSGSLAGAGGLAFAPQVADATFKATVQRPGEDPFKLKGSGRLLLFPGALPPLFVLDGGQAEAEALLGRVSAFSGATLDASPTTRDAFGLQAGPAAAQRGLSSLRLDLKGKLAPGPAGDPAWLPRKASGELRAASPAGLLDADLRTGRLRP